MEGLNLANAKPHLAVPVARVQIQLLQYKRMTPILTDGVILLYGEGGI